MSELTTDLKSLHEATLNNLKSSKANNTLRAYKSDFKDFGLFCLFELFLFFVLCPLGFQRLLDAWCLNNGLSSYVLLRLIPVYV